jgi:hypothetical protein
MLVTIGLVGIGLRSARPDGDVIELESLVLRLTENHRAQASVADRQGLDPLVRGGLIPETICLSARGFGGGDREGHSTQKHETGEHGKKCSTSHDQKWGPEDCRSEAPGKQEWSNG